MTKQASSSLKKLLLLLLILPVFLLNVGAGLPDAGEAAIPEIECGIAEINKYGNVILSIRPNSMLELGYEPADLILVKIGTAEMEMPIGTAYTDADSGEPICCFKTSSTAGEIIALAINAGDFASTLGIAELRRIDAEPGYEWVFAEGFDASVTVSISLVEKQGYAEEYQMHQLCGTRSNKRADYPLLSDAEYANFRAVATTGMGTDTLFRSSSPIRPALNRNAEADEALLTALVRTVMNMADSEQAMRQYADYRLTHYSDCDIIALDMGIDFSAPDYREKLAEGFRFLASHEGPYLIHCQEGKDRTGFAVAILECLMGADAEEVVQDYMLTFYNFYGIGPDSEQYDRIAESNIEAALAKAFGIASLREDGADLAACAESYLREIGMSADEIDALREHLAEDYGGLLRSAA